MNASAQNEKRLLEARIATLEQTIRRIPSRFAGGGTTSAPPILLVVGGNLLPAGMLTTLASGIARRNDAVLATELPPGTGGSPGDTVIVPAWPIPVGLPLGVGVGRNVFTGAYSFVLNDLNSPAPSDLPLSRRLYAGAIINLDKVSGGVTYRYSCVTAASTL